MNKYEFQFYPKTGVHDSFTIIINACDIENALERVRLYFPNQSVLSYRRLA